MHAHRGLQQKYWGKRIVEEPEMAYLVALLLAMFATLANCGQNRPRNGPLCSQDQDAHLAHPPLFEAASEICFETET